MLSIRKAISMGQSEVLSFIIRHGLCFPEFTQILLHPASEFSRMWNTVLKSESMMKTVLIMPSNEHPVRGWLNKTTSSILEGASSPRSWSKAVTKLFWHLHHFPVTLKPPHPCLHLFSTRLPAAEYWLCKASKGCVNRSKCAWHYVFENLRACG